MEPSPSQAFCINQVAEHLVACLVNSEEASCQLNDRGETAVNEGEALSPGSEVEVTDSVAAVPDLEALSPGAEVVSDEPGPVSVPEQRYAILQALLFASAVPVRISELCEVCQWPRAQVESDLLALGQQLRDSNSGLELQRVAGAWQLVTAAQWTWWVQRFLKIQNRRQLSRAQLETLAIVAYRQPVTRAEIDAFRGVRCERIVHQLEDLRLIRQTGRAQTPGHPMLYSTTAEFLRYFSLDKLDELPVVEQKGQGLWRRRVPAMASSSAELASQELALEDAASESFDSAQPAADSESADAGPDLAPSSGLRRLFEKIRRSTPGNSN